MMLRIVGMVWRRSTVRSADFTALGQSIRTILSQRVPDLIVLDAP
ncbi:MAG: hypothetical protein ACO31Z_02940 [Litorivicinaceae bacterium]